jgi:stage II sporulation protein D
MMAARTLNRLLVSTLLLCLAAPLASAHAASRFTIRGAGFGHGVGMSQYGADGFAQHGADYRSILRHYYTDTDIGSADPSQVVRVLLKSARGDIAVTGATKVGRRRLSSTKTYYLRRRGASVQLLSSRKRPIGTYRAPLLVTGRGGKVVLKGQAANGRSNGAYRGTMELRPGPLAGLDAINAVPLDQYVMGVVPAESPSTWPIEALKAQAVAARTYAITTNKPGANFDQYPDTRSQVYGGVSAETPATTAAVVQTRGQVVTYQGQPVVTYFFSTSGGRTENVENTPLGNEPKAWLKSVDDPYDDVSPRHRWGPLRMTFKAVDSKLGSLVKGDFRGIEVVSRGISPRIVTADVIGTGGRTRATGAQLRARLGLFDSWAYFTSIVTGEEPPPEDPAPPTAAPQQPPPTDPTGGTSPWAAMVRSASAGSVAGRVLPAHVGARVTVQLRAGGRWVKVGTAAVRAGGRYSLAVARRGSYRVRYRGADGPTVRVG